MERVTDFRVACGTVKSTKLKFEGRNLRKSNSRFLEIYVTYVTRVIFLLNTTKVGNSAFHSAEILVIVDVPEDV